MDLGLDQKVAVVTGAAQGIGAAIAEELARAGCSIALVDHPSNAAVKQTAERIVALGARALVVPADVTDFGAAEVALQQVAREFGGVDILVCCAGITRDAVSWKMSEEDFDSVIDVNLKGVFNYNRAAATHFRERDWGRIVNIASISGERGGTGRAAYGAAKAGVELLTRVMAVELAEGRDVGPIPGMEGGDVADNDSSLPGVQRRIGKLEPDRVTQPHPAQIDDRPGDIEQFDELEVFVQKLGADGQLGRRRLSAWRGFDHARLNQPIPPGKVSPSWLEGDELPLGPAGHLRSDLLVKRPETLDIGGGIGAIAAGVSRVSAKQPITDVLDLYDGIERVEPDVRICVIGAPAQVKFAESDGLQVRSGCRCD